VKKHTAILATLVVIALALSFAACGEDAPTCTSAMNHMYGQGCTMLVNGTAVSQSEAITGCYENETVANSCGCGSLFDDALQCLADMDSSCTGCTEALAAWSGCQSACG